MAVSEVELPVYPEEILRLSDGKPILGVDWDDDVAPFDKPFRQFVRQTKGVILENPLEGKFSYHEAYPWINITHEEYVEMIAEFSLGPAIDLMEPFQGAIEAIAELSKRYDIHIITARPSEQRPATARLINKHIGEYVTWLHMPNRGEDHLNADKGTLCKLLGAVAMIDDADHNINMVIEKTQGQTKGVLHKNDYHRHNGFDLHPEAIIIPNLMSYVKVDDFMREEGHWPTQKETDELSLAA